MPPHLQHISLQRLRHRSWNVISITPLLLVFFATVAISLPSLTFAQRASRIHDPCSYHPSALSHLRHRLNASLIGQEYAAQQILAHIGAHIQRYETTAAEAESGASGEDGDVQPEQGLHKPLVMSFHGPTGTGKSLSASFIATSLFHTPKSKHVHTYHGSMFSDPDPSAVRSNIQALSAAVARSARECPLSLFFIEEIHLMAPGVLDALRPFMEANVGMLNVKTEVGFGMGSSAHGHSHSHSHSHASHEVDGEDDADGVNGPFIRASFSQVIWLFTTNIGEKQVMKMAHDAARQGKRRADISVALLQESLSSSLTKSPQLSLLRDAAVISALVPFFPLFKSHVKQCAELQLQLRAQSLLFSRKIRGLSWTKETTNFVASRSVFRGPIALWGCKNVQEHVTHGLLDPLTHSLRVLEDDAIRLAEERRKDKRLSALTRLGAWTTSMFQGLKRRISGPTYNLADADVTLRVESGVDESTGQRYHEIVFDIVQPPSSSNGDANDDENDAADDGTGSKKQPRIAPSSGAPVKRTQIRKRFDAAPSSSAASASAGYAHQQQQPQQQSQHQQQTTTTSQTENVSDQDDQQHKKDEL